ncbi:hypothetical protein U3516DRAFT_584359 [Neocallimastix sp. 'constans']
MSIVASSKTSNVVTPSESSKVDELNKISRSTSRSINEGSVTESVASFGKYFKPHSSEDESNLNELNKITAIYTNSMGNLMPLESNDIKSNESINEEENVETIVKDLSGFLNKNNINNINNEPVKSLNDIIEEVPTDDEHNSEIIVEKVKKEYNRLAKLIVDTRMNEMTLYNKCTELSRFLNNCIIKVQAVLNISRNDRLNIVNLNLELEKAWKKIEEKNDNELLLRETIELLKKEIVKYRNKYRTKLDNLPDKLVEDSETIEPEPEKTDYVKELEEKIETLTKENTKQQHSILKLEGESIKKGTDLELLNDENKELKDQITQLQGDFARIRLEKERITREKRKLEVQMEKMNDVLDEKDKETQEKVKEISDINNVVEKYKDELSKEQIKTKNTSKEKEYIEETVEKQLGEIEEQNVKINLLVTENYKNESVIRKLENQITHLQGKSEKLTKLNDQFLKKQKLMEESIAFHEEREDELNKRIEIIKKAEEERIKECERMNKRISELTREREILNRNYIQSLNNNAKQNSIIKVNEQTIKNTEHEIQSYRDEASKMRKIIYSLEKERDLQVSVQSNLKNSLNEKLTTIKLLNLQIDDSRKKYLSLEKKYDDCMKLYEDVKTDRNNYTKKLAESSDEILELKRKNKSNSHTIDNMKEEVRIKETAIAKTHFEKAKLEKEKEYLLNQISNQQNELLNNKMFIKNMQSTEENMRHTLVSMEKDRKKMLIDYENLVKEKDLMQNQIILRNDEITLLYEKLKLQNSALTKGEFYYNERIEDIRVLKLEVKKLRREKNALTVEANTISKLRKEIIKLQDQNVINNTKIKVLEDELETPMNIHRWRKLSGSDPESYELILKIQSLQRRLLKKTEDYLGKEQELREKDKMYEKLKKILERQPGLKTMEQLRYYRESLKSKINESKSLASELNLYQSKVEDYQTEIRRLNEEIQSQKAKYYNQKKKYENLNRKYEISSKIRSYPIKRKKRLFNDINKVNYGELTTV